MQSASARSEPAPGWRRALNLLRLLVSLGLITYLVYQADPRQIWQSWRAINLGLLGLALLIQLLGIAVSALKWGVLLRARGQPQPYRWLFGLYLVGQFASNFLPTTVGGDAVRAIQLGRRIDSYSAASASVFVERLTGFLALSLLGNLALLALALQPAGPLQVPPLFQALTAGFGLVSLAALAAVFGAARLQRLAEPLVPGFARGPFQRVMAALADYAPRGRRLWQVLGLSLLFQLLWVGMHAVCGLALGLSVPLLLYVLMATSTDLLGLAPMFVNNLGAREFVFTLYLGQIGLPPAQAVALALLIFTVRLLVSILGGFVTALGQ